MYLCFIDESQTPPKQGRDRPQYFVIAGVIIHENQWHDIASEFKALKQHPRFGIYGEVKWRFFGPNNASADNPFLHLDQETRDQFRSFMYQIITKRKAVKIIACIASVRAAYELDYVNDEEDLYMYTYKSISERFQYFLQDMERTVGSKQLGIMVADHRGKKQDETLRNRHHDLVDQNSPIFSTYSHYVETLFLTPSHHSVGIQFADMVAGAIGRKFNSRDSYFYDQIEPSFRRSPRGEIDGFGIIKFPKRGWI